MEDEDLAALLEEAEEEDDELDEEDSEEELDALAAMLEAEDKKREAPAKPPQESAATATCQETNGKDEDVDSELERDMAGGMSTDVLAGMQTYDSVDTSDAHGDSGAPQQEKPLCEANKEEGSGRTGGDPAAAADEDVAGGREASPSKGASDVGNGRQLVREGGSASACKSEAKAEQDEEQEMDSELERDLAGGMSAELVSEIDKDGSGAKALGMTTATAEEMEDEEAFSEEDDDDDDDDDDPDDGDSDLEVNEIDSEFERDAAGGLREEHLPEKKAEEGMSKKGGGTGTCEVELPAKPLPDAKEEPSNVKGCLHLADAAAVPKAETGEAAESQALQATERSSEAVSTAITGASVSGPSAPAPKAKSRSSLNSSLRSGAQAKATSLVAKPESMPARPPNAFQLYCKKQEAAGRVASRAAFAALSEDESKPLHAEVLQLQKRYAEEMNSFMKTKDGKRYQRQLEAASQKQKVARAKEKLKLAQPVKPPSAFTLFVSATKGTVGGGLPAARWAKLSEAERSHWENEHLRQMEEYKKAVAAFEKSAAYKKFERTTKAKGGIDLGPKRPPNPFACYIKEMAGKGLDRSALCRGWAELGAEGQKRYVEQSRAASIRYQTEKNEQCSPATGARSRSPLQKRPAEDKAEGTGRAKERRSKADEIRAKPADPPEKPKSAKMLFLDSRRKQIMREEGPKAGSPRELAARLVREWDVLPAEGRKAWESKEKSMQAAYEAAQKEANTIRTGRPRADPVQGSADACNPKARGKSKAHPKRAASSAPKAAAGKRKGDELSFESDEMGSDDSSSSSSSDSKSD